MDRLFRSARWLRFSLWQMLVGMGLSALTCATLIAPTGVLAALWHLTVFGILAFAIAAAVYRNGSTRAFWVGFALFGWLFVGSEKLQMFDMTRIATNFVEKVLFKNLESLYQRQAVEAAEASFRSRIISSKSDYSGVSGQTTSQLIQIEQLLKQCIFSMWALLIALLGGIVGKCLYITRPQANGGAEDRKSPG